MSSDVSAGSATEMSAQGGDSPLRAGAARVAIAPEVPLPMFGYVRRQTPAEGEGRLPLEATALVLEGGGTRLGICGVDTLGISVARSDRIRDAIAAALGTERAAVLLNWNHTHCAPPAGNDLLEASGLLAIESDDDIEAYAELLERRLLELAEAAAARLEPAAVAWGIGSADICVNRREPDETGRIVMGWRPDGLVDQQVLALRAERTDGSPIATVVNFGCHPLSTGMDFLSYTSDFPGALRISLRELGGGEVVFMQGGGGNVLPRASFNADESEAELMGHRLAIEALHALADRPAWPVRWTREGEGSLLAMVSYRRQRVEGLEIELAAAEARPQLPFCPVPGEEELAAEAEEAKRQVAEARERGAGNAELYGLMYHAKWSRKMLEMLRSEGLPESVEAPIQALRIGDGAIVTTPGELFTEIGWAVKERSPGLPTMALGFSNGAVGYLPTAEAYPEGGYEPAYSNRSYGTPATVAPESAELLTKTAVRLAEELFPGRPPFEGANWTVRGPLPELSVETPERPADKYEGPVIAPEPS
jgi:neutral ceramidase